MANHSQKSGFTLIELLVVIAIIGLLSSVVLASLSGARESARDTRRQQDMRQVMTAIELYRNQHGYVPGRGGSCDLGDSDPAAVKLSNDSSCMVNEISSVMSGGVPTDPIGEDGFYYAYDQFHANSSNKCDGEQAAVLGFNQSETGIDDRDTTSGGDQNLDNAAWNRVICWD